ncbi:ATP-binding protein [Streptomyces smyrnaeus]|uniref:ATP-binding protein n=1 Tax=Streptomyces smyrnaeus TaxID=1387713 RepID=UPI0036C3D07C
MGETTSLSKVGRSFRSTQATGTGGPAYSETLPRVGESAGVARRLVQHALGVWHLDVLADPAALVISELVTNAVEHARGENLRVTVARLDDDGVHVSVVDKSRTWPTPQNPDLDDVDGRGLVLIEHMAKQWGTEPKPWGKLVWAELRP